MREVELRLFTIAAKQTLDPYGGIECLQLNESDWKAISDEIHQCSKMVDEKSTVTAYWGIPVHTCMGFPANRVTAVSGGYRIVWAANGQLFDELTGELVKAITNSLRHLTPLDFGRGGLVRTHRGQGAFGPGSYPGSEVILPRRRACTHIPAAPVPQWNEQLSTYLVPYPRPGVQSLAKRSTGTSHSGGA